MARRIGLRRLNRTERVAVLLLRGGRLSASVVDPAPFARLRVWAAEARLTVLSSDVDRVSDDELALMGWMSLLQRRQIRKPKPVSHPIEALVRRCAVALDAAGYRLIFASQIRVEPLIDRFADPTVEPRGSALPVDREPGDVARLGMTLERDLAATGSLRERRRPRPRPASLGLSLGASSPDMAAG